MIQRLSHVSIYVLDQESAKAFYTEKLGFEVRREDTMGSFRWLTVGPKGQPEFEMILMGIQPGPMLDETACERIRELVAKGAFGVGIFATADCRATFEDLKSRGVEFVFPPTERPYGIEALLKDDSGNWFSLVQRT